MSDSLAEIAYDMAQERMKERKRVGNDDPLDAVSDRSDLLEKKYPLQTIAANQRQVGGSHYGLRQRQHWDVVVEFDLDYFQGQITKYVFRWDKKNGIQDLEKAQHFLEKYIEAALEGRLKKWSPKDSHAE